MTVTVTCALSTADLAHAEFDAEIDLEKLQGRTSEKWARYPQDILPVFVAESDFPLTAPIADALHRAIDAGDLGYAQPKGVGEAYATFSRDRFQYETDPASVFVIPEVMVGVAEILRMVTAPGDRVIINPPVYPPFFATISEVGRTIAEVPLTAREDGFHLNFEALEREFASGAGAYLFCNPHNPTGRVFSAGDVLRVATLAKKYGVVVLADEVHAPLVLPGTAHSPFESIIATTGVNAITLTSASKGWNIAGLKCALAISSSHWGRSILKRLPGPAWERTGHLGVIATLSAFAQGAAYLDRIVKHLDQQRATLQRLLMEYGLTKIGYAAPQAGYLAWLDCRDLGLGPDPAAILLKVGKVALFRGLDFGKPGVYCARLNFGTSTQILREAVTRIRAALPAHV